ncbi:MAG: ECF transporter S component [Caldisericia bacterium]|nr:ECF transporter S component [Caldisericia bacterium]
MKKSVNSFTTVSLLVGLAIALEYFIAVPILPSAPFLLYSPGDLPLLFIGYFFGPLPGILGSAIKAIVFTMFRGDGHGIWGMLMNFIASGAFVFIFSILSRSKIKNGLVYGLIAGTLARTGIMIPSNLLITPIVFNIPVAVVKSMLLPAIVPFNLIHSGLNSIFFYFLVPRLKPFFHKK